MSETDEHQPDRGHSTATDPRGTVEAGEPDIHHHSTGAAPARTTADMSPEERAYNRNLYGLTYRERYGKGEAVCVAYCLQPGQRRRGVRCPACYGEVHVRPLNGSEVEPGPTRADRFAAWVGSWAGAFADAMLYPFRVGRAHTQAMVRDILRDALADGLQIDVLSDMLGALEDIRQELRAIRDQADKIGEESCRVT